MNDIEHNYFITWKTFSVNGNNSEGSFLTYAEVINNETIEGFIEYVKETVPSRLGRGLMITGIFKIN